MAQSKREPCSGDEEEVITAICPTIPASNLERKEGSTHPKYDVAVVEAIILETAAELHPRRVTADELVRGVVGNPHDDRETETAKRAIRGLRKVCLFRDGDDEIVEPTPAGLHAVKLLT